ncbi:MAG: hypothetical protein ACAH89_05720 [Rariglobus sp.]
MTFTRLHVLRRLFIPITSVLACAIGSLTLGGQAYAVPIESVSALIPDGLYFEANDHLQSASEPLQFTYKTGADDLSKLRQGIRFTVTDLTGTTIAQGTATDVKAENGLAVCTLLAPGHTSTWKEGWYNLRTSPVAEPDAKPFNFKFRYLSRPNAARVVYLLDGPTPEGYAEWLNTGFTPAVEPLKSFPAGGQPDLVIVSHWASLAPGLAARLQSYVSTGGRLVIFGDTTAEIDSLAPLQTDRANPYHYAPVAIGKNLGLDSLKSWAGHPVIRLNTKLAAGAEALASTDDGQPFLAVKKIGSGLVYSVAAPLKPGAVYDGLLHALLKLPAKPATSPAQPDADGFTLGASHDNIGRFGWLNNDRVHDLGIQPDRSFRMWDVTQDTFRVAFPPFTDEGTGQISCADANWVGKHLVGTGGVFGSRTELYFGLGAPGVLYRNTEATQIRLRVPSASMLAWPTATGSRVVKIGETAFTPEGMNRPWLLLWNGEAVRRHEWPLLINTSRHITSIRRIDADTLEFTFAKPGVDLTVMAFGGVRHFTHEEVAAWNPLPAAIVSRADWWNRVHQARPIACEERYRLNREANTVEVRDRFDYLHLQNDFGVTGIHIAPVPPLLPITAAQNLATLPASVTATGVDTFCGPFHAAAGTDTVTYTLPVPDMTYPLATKPVDPGLGDPLVRQLFERICEHAALPRNLYLPVYFMPIEKAKGATHPERDLRAASYSKSTHEIRDKLFIDLHRNLGGTYGQNMFKPYLDGVPGYDESRRLLNEKIERNLLRDVGFFQYKTFLRYNTEPNGGVRYPMTFLGPVRFADGYRFFHDMNETASIVLYSFDAYAQTGGDPAFLADNLPYIEATASYVTGMNDWAWMSSMACDWGMGNNIDMLNGELSTWVAMHRIHARLGHQERADFAAYMAARASISATARFFFGAYYNGLHFPDWVALKAPTHEMAAMEQQARASSKFLPFGLTNGYGEGWPSLWPNDLSPSYLNANLIGLDIYNHSKGVCPELFSAYRAPALQPVLSAYEAAFRQACRAKKLPIYYTRLAATDFITGDHAGTVAELRRTLADPQASAKTMGAGTADWEISSMVLLLESLRTHPPASSLVQP